MFAHRSISVEEHGGYVAGDAFSAGIVATGSAGGAGAGSGAGCSLGTEGGTGCPGIAGVSDGLITWADRARDVVRNREKQPALMMNKGFISVSILNMSSLPSSCLFTVSG